MPTPTPAIEVNKERPKPPSTDDSESKPPSPNTFAGGQVTVSLIAEVEADERAGVYFVSPHANYLFEDEVQIRTKKHLLNTGKVTTEDKTVEIIGTVASIAANISGRALFSTGGQLHRSLLHSRSIPTTPTKWGESFPTPEAWNYDESDCGGD